MRDVPVDMTASASPVCLGRVGENRVVRLRFEPSAWAQEFPGGRLALFMERPDGRKYVAAVEPSGSSWSYTLTSADLAMAGRGRMQMQWMVGDQIARSKIIDTITMASIMASEGPPGYPEQGYLEQMAAIGAQAVSAVRRAEAAAEGLSGMGARAETLEQVESAITGKGYQTAQQVESAITGKGYQTSAQVEAAIAGKGYQTSAQVQSAISAAGHLKRAIVEALPQAGSADENTVYMMLAEGAEGENIYEEWMVIDGVWERIGSTDVDLSGYLQEADLVEITDEEIDQILAS